MTSLPRLLTVLLLSLWSSVPLLAQDAGFAGVITVNDVEVRSGGGVSYYIVGRLPVDTPVEVREQIFEWYAITPPPGVFSYVSKAYIDAKGDGNKQGIANSDRVKVFAASLAGPGESFRRQLTLFKGDTVTIVGEEGGFYKILPPKGTLVYVPVSAVRKGVPAVKPATSTAAVARSVEEVLASTPAPAAKPVPAPAPVPASNPAPQVAATSPQVDVKPLTAADLPPLPSSAPAATPAPASTATPTPAPASDPVTLPMVAQAPAPAPVVAPAAPVVTPPTPAPAASAAVVDAAPEPAPAALPAPTPAAAAAATGTDIQLPEPLPAATTDLLRAVEQRFAAAQDLPLPQRPLKELLQAYELVKRAPDLPLADQRLVYARMVQLKRDADLQATLARISDVQQSVAAEIAAEPAPAPQPAAPTYNAMGVLTASVVYNGRSLPQLYRLVNPANQRTVVYVHPTQAVLPAAHLGRTVGLLGEIRYDAGLRLQVLDPTQVDVLESPAPAAN